MGIAEILTEGVKTMVVGLSVVFLVLAILIGFIKLLTGGLSKLDGSKKEKAPEEKPVPAPATPVAAVEPEEDEDEIAAVIAAAVAMMAQNEGSRLAVRSVRRVGQNAPAWRRASR